MKNEPKETIDYKNCLIKIYYDEDGGFSPRENSNLGYFITVDRNYHSPDENEQLEAIIKETGDIATSQENHINLIKEQYDCIAIYPIVKYEHGSVSYSLGQQHGFDYSNNGFYIITDKSQKDIGTKPKDFKKVIMQELKEYNQYISGEVYRFNSFDEYGNDIGNCGGVYDEDYLIVEAKAEIDNYIKATLPKVKQERARAEFIARHNVNLFDLSQSENEAVKRNAISLIKQLKIK